MMSDIIMDIIHKITENQYDVQYIKNTCID